MSEDEPKWFSGYVKTHDQDHQELERKLEQKQDLFPLHKGVQNKPLMNIISELEEKLNSHIEDFQSALREIIYKHINTQGDEYGEDIQELLRMMDGFKEKQGIIKEKFREPKKIWNPNLRKELDKEKEPPQNKRTFEENFKRIKEKELPTPSQREQYISCPYCALDVNITKPLQEQKQVDIKQFLADLRKGWKWVIAKEKYWIARNKVSYQMIFQLLLDVNRLIYGKWQKKKDAEKPKENSSQEWKKIFFVLGEGECEFYRDDATCKRADNGTKRCGCNEMWCERKIRIMEKKEDNEAKKRNKCNIMGIECLFPKIDCSECIVNKEYHIGSCPETQKLIEKYKKDLETAVSRTNTHTEEDQ